MVICLFITPFLVNTKKQPDKPSAITPEKNKCELLIEVNDTTISVEEYLVGVLAGEMPANFQLEALKAQAIAARTYVLKQTNFGEKPILSTTAHQVYQDQNLRKEKWKTAFSQNEQKLQLAVQQTEQQVLTYNEQLITAMFHASSNRQTESAENYSGNEIPYLIAVTSPEQPDQQPLHMTFKQLNKLLQSQFTAADYQNAQIKKNSTGRIQQIKIANQSWTGREFRELLALRSTDFTWQPSTTGVTLITTGYGHGVGMSQQGANTMAQSGSTAAEIVAHYYPQTTVQTINYCQK